MSSFISIREPYTIKHYIVTGVFLIGWFLSITFFFSMWITGWVLGEPLGYTFQTTFSEMLANIPVLTPLYWVWFGFYTVSCFFIISLVVTYNVHFEGLLPEFWQNKKAYIALICITQLYVLFTLTKLLGLVFLAVYNMDDTPHQHFIAASIAFGFAIGASLTLCIRRWILAFPHNDVYKIHIQHYLLEPVRSTEEMNLYFYKLKRNAYLTLVWVLIEGALAISFLQTGLGSIEFFLCLFIMFDILWQIDDFYINPKSIQTHDKLFKISSGLFR